MAITGLTDDYNYAYKPRDLVKINNGLWIGSVGEVLEQIQGTLTENVYRVKFNDISIRSDGYWREGSLDLYSKRVDLSWSGATGWRELDG